MFFMKKIEKKGVDHSLDHCSVLSVYHVIKKHWYCLVSEEIILTREGVYTSSYMWKIHTAKI